MGNVYQRSRQIFNRLQQHRAFAFLASLQSRYVKRGEVFFLRFSQDGIHKQIAGKNQDVVRRRVRRGARHWRRRSKSHPFLRGTTRRPAGALGQSCSSPRVKRRRRRTARIQGGVSRGFSRRQTFGTYVSTAQQIRTTKKEGRHL